MLKLELYLSKGTKPELIGVAHILLKELLDIDRVNSEKKKVISSMVDVMSSANTDVSIGRLKYKLRLRNTFTQAIKFYNERKIAEGRKIEQAQNKSKVKNLFIEIIECDHLSRDGINSDNLKPFCYYQFHKFDEHYTIASAGSNPRFDDTSKYEVAYTPDFVNYLDSNTLDIIILDDSAPLNQQDDTESKLEDDKDIIGTAKVNLKLLALSKEVSGPVPILNSKGQHSGNLKIRITVTDPVRKYAGARGGGSSFVVTTLWERDTIKTISEYIVKSTKIRDVDSVFEIFSKRKEKITHDDFKTTVMPLKCGLSEREVDLFIRSSILFLSGSKDAIDKKEFLGVFSQPLFDAFEKYERIDKQQEEEEKSRGPKATETDTDLDRNTNQNASTVRGESTRDKVTKQDIMRNIDDIKDKLEKYLKKENLTLKDFWNKSFENKKEMPPNKFANRLTKIEGLEFSKFEAHILFKYIDEGDMGKIRYKDMSLA